ncbi:mechanosensitive ion channel domain-containing protein [Arthrobacter sp. H5]|uniref:mechanosensitive ion channel family protein n=1 Tax=Arthrobacter sp. H5 TaxID=1267973 RepID=UPI0004B268C1|nr:mechanosensitive ion channel domain-containing protein [Arthrobacter sp. H5]
MQFLDHLGVGGDLIGAAIIIVVALLIWLVLRFLINRMVGRVQHGYEMLKKPHFKWAQPVLRSLDDKRRTQRAETIGSLLRSVSGVGIAIIAVIMALSEIGLNIGPILASVGIVGIAIGFGAREIIRDAFLGFFITIEDQYGIGDVIEVGDTVGVVQSVGLRITRMVDENGTIWYIRNGDIMKVGNRSQGNYVEPEKPQETSQPTTTTGTAGKAT